MAEHEQVYQINGECQQCGRMYCDNGEQCALAIALRTERNIADQSEEIAQLRAALAESQRRETAMAEELLRLRELERRVLAAVPAVVHEHGGSLAMIGQMPSDNTLRAGQRVLVLVDE